MGAMINFRTVWRRHGSEIPLSNKTVLYLQNVSYLDTGNYVCLVQYQLCDANSTSNTKKNLTRTTFLDVQGTQYAQIIFVFSFLWYMWSKLTSSKKKTPTLYLIQKPK
jgi:hypothetical protein